MAQKPLLYCSSKPIAFDELVACSAGFLLGQVNVKKLANVCLTGLVSLKIFTAPEPLSSPFFRLSLTTLVRISFSLQNFAAVKVKDESHNFHQHNTEYKHRLKLCLHCRSMI